METGPGLALIIFLLTISGLFPHPLSDLENDNVPPYVPVSTDITPECPLGFRFDKVNNNCEIVWLTAGTSNGDENLSILCANGEFDKSSKTCILNIKPSLVISVPLVCRPGMEKDQNGFCRESFDG
ncbi:hypothetical protein HA402_000773 [Bradysia odoriphaga]|nr:hypothetical protein HA402_000773 [Bradysia odoriphaga]